MLNNTETEHGPDIAAGRDSHDRTSNNPYFGNGADEPAQNDHTILHDISNEVVNLTLKVQDLQKKGALAYPKWADTDTLEKIIDVLDDVDAEVLAPHIKGAEEYIDQIPDNLVETYKNYWRK